MTTDVINGVPREPFQREERYVVVKISKMHPRPEFRRRHLAALKAENIAALVDCVVIEKGWPEYETVWKMIEARMTGATAQPAADGGREVWAVPVLDGEKKTTFYTEQLPFVPGIGVKQLGEPVRMVEARAAQPQQAVAVTDEVLRDAERYRYIRSEGIPDEAIAIVDSFYGELELVSPKRLDAAIDAALAAHKTGEEE